MAFKKYRILSINKDVLVSSPLKLLSCFITLLLLEFAIITLIIIILHNFKFNAPIVKKNNNESSEYILNASRKLLDLIDRKF